MSHDSHAHPLAHSDHDAHETHHVNYLLIFGILCVCTALSVFFDVIKMNKGLTIVLVLAVAVTKAMCVMMFFMHLKFEGNWKFVLLAPTTILAIGLPLALYPDVGASYYTSTAPQITSWADEVSKYDKEHAKHAEQSTDPEHTGPGEPAHAE